MLVLKKQQFFSVFLLSEAEMNLIARLFLSQAVAGVPMPRKLFLITTRCLVIGHQDDQFSIGSNCIVPKLTIEETNSQFGFAVNVPCKR